jgi:hypothetical protein
MFSVVDIRSHARDNVLVFFVMGLIYATDYSSNDPGELIPLRRANLYKEPPRKLQTNPMSLHSRKTLHLGPWVFIKLSPKITFSIKLINKSP